MAVVPRAAQTNHKVQQLREVLDEVRTQCNTVETNLASALQPEHSATSVSREVMSEGRRSIAELQRESRRLLAEVFNSLLYTYTYYLMHTLTYIHINIGCFIFLYRCRHVTMK